MKEVATGVGVLRRASVFRCAEELLLSSLVVRVMGRAGGYVASWSWQGDGVPPHRDSVGGSAAVRPLLT